MFSSLTNQPKVKAQVVDRRDLLTEHFVHRKKVTQIGFAIGGVDPGQIHGVNGIKIIGPFSIFDINRTLSGK